MKKIMMVAMSLIIACSASFAQVTKDTAKYEKMAEKEAKEMKKAGWIVTPGALPLEEQLLRSYLMQNEIDDATQLPKYIYASAQSVGETYDAAKMLANTVAITELAGKIQTDVVALGKTLLANSQISSDEAASIEEGLQASKNFISQSIGRVITIVECYRVTKNNNREVQIRIAYNEALAKEIKKQAILQQISDKGEILNAQLDLLLGL